VVRVALVAAKKRSDGVIRRSHSWCNTRFHLRFGELITRELYESEQMSNRTVWHINRTVWHI